MFFSGLALAFVLLRSILGAHASITATAYSTLYPMSSVVVHIACSDSRSPSVGFSCTWDSADVFNNNITIKIQCIVFIGRHGFIMQACCTHTCLSNAGSLRALQRHLAHGCKQAQKQQYINLVTLNLRLHLQPEFSLPPSKNHIRPSQASERIFLIKKTFK